MQYEIFESRIKKLADFIKLIIKHLVKVAIGAAAVFAVIIGLMVAKGIILSTDSCPEEISYGDRLYYNVKAFMSKVKYEYYVDGAWTEEMPIAPGSYKVRAAAKATIGYRYGDEEKFTILPLEIEVSVNEGQITYGEEPTASGSTVYGDYIVCDEFIYNEYRTTVKPDPSDIRIYDAEGKDVTKNYKVKAVERDIVYVSRPITIETVSDSKIYDGKQFINSEYTITSGSLAYEDKIIITLENGITDVGSMYNYFEFEINNSKGEDVTELYDVYFNPGMLTVEPRPITIETMSINRVYDGLPTYFDYFEEVGEYGVVKGHTIESWGWNEIFEHGTVTNSASFDIYDKDGNYCTYNYEITTVFGEIVTAKRPVTIKTPTESRDYSGFEWSNTALECDNLSENDYFSIINWTNIKYVGKVTNEIEFEIYNFYRGGSVKDNYEITYEEGTLEVVPLTVYVFSDSDDITYTGSEVSCTDFSISPYKSDELPWGHYAEIRNTTVLKDVCDYVDNVISVVILEYGEDVSENFNIVYDWGKVRVIPRDITIYTPDYYDYFSMEAHSCSEDVYVWNLVEGHTLEVYDSTSLIYPGRVKNEFYKYDILDENGKSVLRNYDPSFEYGYITVWNRPVTISSASAEKYYDRTPLTASGWYVPEDSYLPLIEGNYIVCNDTVYGSQTEVGSSYNWWYYNSSIEIYSADGERLTDYYQIGIAYGTLTVKPRPITVVTESGSAMFDDEYHSWTKIELSPDSVCDLLPGDEMYVAGYSSIRYVSQSGDNNSILVQVHDNNWYDVSYNYEIIYDYGYIEITPRPITVSTNSINEVYNDCDFYDYWIDVTDGYGLCGGHYLVVDYNNLPIFHDAIYGAKNEILFYIADYDEGGFDVTENYDITYDYGEVNISKRPITVESSSYEAEYDGLEHSGTLTYVRNEWGLCYGHSISITNVPVFKDVIYTENNIEFVILKNGVEDVTHNYEITYNYGIINITPRVVHIATASNWWYYDGEPHSDQGYYVLPSASSFIRTHAVKIPASTTITEVGQEHNNIIFEVFDETGNNVTYNYDIVIIEYGLLQIVGENDTPGPDIPLIPDDPKDEEELPDSPLEEDDSSLNEGGDLGLPPMTPGDAEPVTVYYIFSSTGGTIYLKLKSFGDYTGSGWLEADPYAVEIDDFKIAFLTSKALEAAGRAEGYMRITSVYHQYVLPYYTSKLGIENDTNDVRPLGDASSQYNLNYYSWNYTPGLTVPEEYAEYEKAYSEYVHSKYLTIDDQTLSFMQGIIEKQGFDINDPTLISDVAKYIQNSASYNLFYDRALDQSENIVTAFLETYKEGVCQHYAAAATMLYRAIGIPARYTIGYVGNVAAGDISEVKSDQGHAWVEVYINGLGWINVEVTGSGFNMGDGSGSDKEPEKETIVVEPLYQYKDYNGEPFYAEDLISEVDPVLAELLKAGYTYTVDVYGYLDYVGKTLSWIQSFELFDPDGNRVTDDYIIEYKDGTIEMGNGIIKIYLYEKWYEYSGNAVSYAIDDFVIISAPGNVEFVMNSINISRTNVGGISSNEINRNIGQYFDYSVYVDGGSDDYSAFYALVVVNFIGDEEYIPLNITPREITITTASETKVYDGDPLTNDGFYVSKGILVDGHKINLSVIGTVTAKGESSFNTIDKDSLIIYDAKGNDVTHNYEVVYNLGVLTVK